MKNKANVTRKDTREHLAQLHLACELVKAIKHFFPGLLPMLRKLPDPRNQSYITYSSQVLLMTRILSSIFYISSMRKTSEEFNSEAVIENIGYLCEEPELKELPYWETINDYLKRLEPALLQETVCALVRRLLRMRSFEGNRVRGKYWQIIIDGTQLDKRSLFRVHKRGTPEEYTEYYYYVLEAKIVLQPDIVVSIMTEFVENEGYETEKQDCERKAGRRLMERLKKEFPCLPVCLCADSLYACRQFFSECEKKHWKYVLRFKEGSIPSIEEEYKAVREIEKNCKKTESEEGSFWYDYVEGIEYEGHRVNLAEYGKIKACGEEQTYQFLTNLGVNRRNVEETIERGRMRWKIENEGFNTQKRQGYNLEHMSSHDYQAMKNHYYLIQIGNMISQIIESWKKIWEKVKQSREQKHRRLLEAWKKERIKERLGEIERKFQIRFV